MRTVLGGLLLATTAAVAQAQSASAELHVSHDSDGLNQRQLTAGFSGAAGWGLKAGAMRFTGPDGWNADGQRLVATYRHESEGVQLDANAGVVKLGSHDRAVGALDVMRKVASASSLGLSVERNLVDSVRGIDAGLVFTSLALVADHAFNERFNVGLAGGSTWFSNDNRRPFLRTRWNASLYEPVGLNAYLKTRSYRNSNPYRAEYFSPERLNEVSLGLSTRLAVAGRAVLSAALDSGQQHTEAGREAIWSVSVGVSSVRDAPLRWSLALQAANTAALFGGDVGNYRYTSLLGQMNVPF
jgi:hypothetical protein